MSGKDNSGALFKNEKKSENSPDYSGTAMVDGVDYRIAAWIKQGKSGTFMSLAFTRKTEEKKREPNGGGIDEPF